MTSDSVRRPWRLAALSTYLPRIGAVASLAMFGVVAWYLHRELATLSLAEVEANVRSVSWTRLGLAVAFAAGSYLALTAYDALAVRYLGKSLSYARTALTAFMAFAVGHNVGMAALSGGAIRYRIYSTLGLSAIDIAKVIAFCSVTFAIGGAFLFGLAVWLMPATHLESFGLPIAATRAAGAALLLLAMAYVGWPLLGRAAVSIANWRIEVPRFGIATGQLCASAADIVFASATLYVLVAPTAEIGYFAFLGFYVLAISAGVVSNVPGGIGVFEAVLLIALPDVDREALLSAIIVYRVVYYFVPLALALTILGAYEISPHRRGVLAAGSRIARALSSIAPQISAVAAFLAGVVLLISGATPAVESRLRIISELLPHSVLELSHLAGSVVGVALLVLARGLNRRLASAYRIVFVLLAVGAAASLLKGLDYEEAALLCVALSLLWATRNEFYRRGSVLDQRISAPWLAVVVIALLGAIWVGAISYRQVPYSNELWWQFSIDGDAPRMLRAALLATVTAIALSLSWLVRPAPPRGPRTGAEDLSAVRRVITQARSSLANAALLGDKRILTNADKTAFIMYQVAGRSWIALGDPVGPVAEREALAWEFRELCDRYDSWPAFYEVSDESLPLYIDMGLTLSKLGEEARVNLAEFSFDGKRGADFRQARHRAERSGAAFSVVARDEVPGLIPELRRVSDDWLKEKKAAEKGFSLGRFSPDYLANFDCALVRVNGTLVAFANIWPAPAAGEVSIDLMRHSADAPKGVMDFLFAELMLWGKTQHYVWFNLGMAPLSGLEQHALAPFWHKFGNLVFRHGEDFYNFEGLRSYKEKFNPVWRPSYLACKGGWAVPRVLFDSAALIAGGMTRVVSTK